MARPKLPKCLCCGMLFRADPRNARHQKYCAEPICRKASKAASQRAWQAKPENQDYFHGPENVARVQAGEPPTRGIGGDRPGSEQSRPLRYKISARRNRLKQQVIPKSYRRMRYKISCRPNRLF